MHIAYVRSSGVATEISPIITPIEKAVEELSRLAESCHPTHALSHVLKAYGMAGGISILVVLERGVFEMIACHTDVEGFLPAELIKQ